MNNTPEQVARRLGTSRRRVVSAARRLGVGRLYAGQWLFSAPDFERLAAELGVDVGGPLPRAQMRVLAELSLRPHGLVSARAVAVACGLAPATSSAALKALVADGLVVVRDGVFHVDVLHPRWLELRPAVRQVRQPVPTAEPGDESCDLEAA